MGVCRGWKLGRKHREVRSRAKDTYRRIDTYRYTDTIRKG